MPVNSDNFNKTKSMIPVIYQSMGIIMVVLGLLYFPVNTKINAMEEKFDMYVQNHEKDCKLMMQDTKELQEKVEKKIEEKDLEKTFEPLKESVTELKNDLKIFLQQDRLFKQEIIKKLN